MIPAFGYLRVSGASQVDGDGFPRQRAAIESYAAAKGFEIVRWFEEGGVSGETEWGDRPAWSEMVASLNGTKTIIVEKLDRLARQLLVQELILRDLKRRSVDLLTAAGEDTSDADPTRVMFRQMVGIFSQYEKSMIVLKLRAAKNRIKARGERAEGRKPYGIEDPEEAEILAWMKQCRAAGQTFDAIAGALNGSGRTTRYGKAWLGVTVGKILRREDAR